MVRFVAPGEHVRDFLNGRKVIESRFRCNNVCCSLFVFLLRCVPFFRDK